MTTAERSGPADFAALLEQAGFRIHGRRADCIHCEGHSRLTVAFTDEVAFCHRCKWTANIRTLARELDLPVTPRTRADREKHMRCVEFECWVNTCHKIIIRHVRYLTRRAELAKTVLCEFPDCEPAWSALADYYHNEAPLFGALDFLTFEKLSPWLEQPMTRERLAAAFNEACERSGARNAA